MNPKFDKDNALSAIDFRSQIDANFRENLFYMSNRKSWKRIVKPLYQMSDSIVKLQVRDRIIFSLYYQYT